MTIERVDGFDVFGNFVSECHKESICVKTGSTNGEVFNNMLEGQADYKSTGIYIAGGSDSIRAYDNYIYDFAYGGIGISIGHERDEYGNMDGIWDIDVFNNIIFSNYVGIAVHEPDEIDCDPDPLSPTYDDAPIDDIYIFNNTVANSEEYYYYDWEQMTWVLREYAIGIDIDSPCLELAEIANNLVTESDYYDLEANRCTGTPWVLFETNLSADYVDNGSGQCDYYEYNSHLEANPHLDGNYHLTSLSTSAIDEANPYYMYGENYDIDGDSRTIDDGPDIGADEYVP